MNPFTTYNYTVTNLCTSHVTSLPVYVSTMSMYCHGDLIDMHVGCGVTLYMISVCTCRKELNNYYNEYIVQMLP